MEAAVAPHTTYNRVRFGPRSRPLDTMVRLVVLSAPQNGTCRLQRQTVLMGHRPA
jgi:hypothetical protein